MRNKKWAALLSGASGLIYGVLSFPWLLLGAACAFPGTAPGSRDWAEDAALIPFGFFLLLAFLCLQIVLLIRLRRRGALFFSASLCAFLLMVLLRFLR